MQRVVEELESLRRDVEELKRLAPKPKATRKSYNSCGCESSVCCPHQDEPMTKENMPPDWPGPGWVRSRRGGWRELGVYDG